MRKFYGKVATALVAVVALIMFLFAGGAQSAPASPAPAKVEVLKVGVPTTLSGGAMPWGVGQLRGIDLVFGEQNAAGGITIGGKTYMLQTVPYDNLYLPDKNIEAVTKLLHNDKVKFIVSHGGGPTTAAQSITEPAKLIYFSAGFGTEILAKGKNYTFRPALSSYEASEAMWPWIAKKYPQVKKLAITGPNDESGWGTARDITKFAKNEGVTVIEPVFYERGLTDFTALLTGLLAKNPDAIDTGGTPPAHSALMIKQVRELGYKGLLLSNCPASASVINKIAGAKPAEGYIGSLFRFDMTGPKSTPELKSWYDRYTAKFGEELVVEASHLGGVPAEILVQAIVKANSLETDAIKKVLETEKFDTHYGKVWFSRGDVYGVPHQLVVPVPILVFTDGKWVVVDYVQQPGAKPAK